MVHFSRLSSKSEKLSEERNKMKQKNIFLKNVVKQNQIENIYSKGLIFFLHLFGYREGRNSFRSYKIIASYCSSHL